ncbi:uncharacterized protein NPIL_199861 [Nephila pilipes]|uniref:Uncharacterized protein n=1 Tax=Nephila pilipes TaxID=299642 RepID=A0A8X6NEN6_NEPPI|nr:uncharacterized protein NPIL_199861 [Nephila pilipes]
MGPRGSEGSSLHYWTPTHPTPLVNDQTSCRWMQAWNDLDIWNEKTMVFVVVFHFNDLRFSERPPEKEPPATTSNSFMRIGSLNLRKARKSTVFASVRGGSRNRNSIGDMRFGSHASMRKKLHKSMPPLEKKSELEKKNDSDSDSNYGFSSKKQDS